MRSRLPLPLRMRRDPRCAGCPGSAATPPRRHAAPSRRPQGSPAHVGHRLGQVLHILFRHRPGQAIGNMAKAQSRDLLRLTENSVAEQTQRRHGDIGRARRQTTVYQHQDPVPDRIVRPHVQLMSGVTVELRNLAQICFRVTGDSPFIVITSSVFWRRGDTSLPSSLTPWLTVLPNSRDTRKCETGLRSPERQGSRPHFTHVDHAPQNPITAPMAAKWPFVHMREENRRQVDTATLQILGRHAKKQRLPLAC